MSPMTDPSTHADPRIADLLRSADRPLLSYEFFPPKTEAGLRSLEQTVQGLSHTRPDFVTVTYGAGGSTQNLTFEVAALLRRFHFHPVMPHLTCVGASREDLHQIAERIHEEGFRNVMTLRGDPPKGMTDFQATENGLSCARDLVALLKTRHPDLCLGVAGYPEGHPDAVSTDSEIAYLKEKVDAGADFITTQLFFDNTDYYRFRDRCEQAGISVPILPGIMPALSLPQIRRFLSMCGSALPPELEKRLEIAGDDKEKSMNAGILWSMEQIVDLLQNDVPGIHLYVLNQIRPAMAYQLAQTFMEMTRGR